jgi:hypothetical protein
MRSCVSRIAASFSLLLCVICPLLEMFDRWDHTLQTGNDTEYALIVLALCVGAAYWFARLILNPTVLRLVTKGAILSGIDMLFVFARGCSSLLFDATSPPPLSLRI